MRARAFQGLVPLPEKAFQVASVPYDVVDRAEAAALAAGNPLSYLHVVRAEIDLPADTHPYSDAVYAKAAENFQQLQSAGVLVRESRPSVYLYRQIMGAHVQTGVALACHIEDYERDIIRKHEKTRTDKEIDRTRIVRELNAHAEPVFLTYRPVRQIDALVESITSGEAPLCDFTAPDGVRHLVWKVPGGGELERLFAAVPLAYVADGHHRTASAFRVGAERRAANPHHDGSEPYNWFLAVLFPADQLQILPYNRTVSSLNGLSKAEFLRRIRESFVVEATGTREPGRPCSVSMFLAGTWYSLSWTPGLDSDPVRSLDVSVLQDRLLAPILGVDDPRTSDRIDFVGGIRGTAELETRVNSGKAAVAFSLCPVTCDQLMAIADAGQIMPPKSTWFEPKLRSGLFVFTLGEVGRCESKK